MASKYDEFWQAHAEALADLIERATTGESGELDVEGLRQLGERSSWYGTAVVRGRDHRGSMAHVAALAKIVAELGLCVGWPSVEFRFTVSQALRLTVSDASGSAVSRRRVVTVPPPSIAPPDVADRPPVDAAVGCAEVHRLIGLLPLLEAPAEVPFSNGLYFFYEAAETSEHAPAGRIVRIGNHPRAQDRLKARLGDHYRTRGGAKNGSVFRRYLGGALIRRDDAASACLLPGPGAGHWEHQRGAACDACAHYEERVTEYLRRSLRFRCLRIDDMAERNRFEGRIIATVADCPVCRPSAGWLGGHGYSAAVRASGLWNSDFVGGPQLDQHDLRRLQELTDASEDHLGAGDGDDTDLSDTLLILPCCQSKRGHGSIDLPLRSVADFLSADAAESLKDGRVAAFQRPGTTIDRSRTPEPALRLYTGQPYEMSNLRDELLSLMQSGLHCLIVSGGYGLVRPEEPIHYYEAQIQRTAPVWRKRIPLLLADYIERQGIQRTFGAFSRQYASVVPTHLTGNDWRAVPLFSRGDEGSAYHEVPRRVGAAVMRLIDARFKPESAEGGETPWLRA